MITDRNTLSHRYDFDAMEQILPTIQERYIPFLNQFAQDLTRD